MSTKPSTVLQIKKYPNRRYYDATRSCHVTLNDIYDLIRAGHSVCITESRDSLDITNLVLMQILLEKDQPKMDVFPPALLHQVIRANTPALKASVERFFGPLSQMMTSSQQQFEAFWRQAFPGRTANSMDWTNAMMSAMAPDQQGQTPQPQQEPPSDEHGESDDLQQPPAASAKPSPASDVTLNEMREQIAELNSRLEELSKAPFEQDA